MKNKSRSSQNNNYVYGVYKVPGGYKNISRCDLALNESIIYGEGPRRVDFHSNWKPCEHLVQRTRASLGFAHARHPNGTYHDVEFLDTRFDQGFVLPSHDLTAVKLASSKVQEKLDLNCKDRLMGYSYVADLVPLAGPFLKASGVLNRIGRWAAKRWRSYRRRPFWSVMKDVIQADLINRFVIQTTIQDTKHILDVYDQCLRAFSTANKRNYEATTLTGVGSSTNLRYYSHAVLSSSDRLLFAEADIYRGVQTTSKVVATLRLKYNTQQADPLMWVANALGITTPLESIWDKIPFSFVVDYFLRVGDFINYVGDQYTSQQGLCAKIVDVLSCWAMTKSTSGLYYDNIVQGDSYLRPSWTVHYELGKSAFSGGSLFTRESIEMSDLSGFWDKGGLWDPSLSSVRKRTLLELGIQIGGKKLGFR